MQANGNYFDWLKYKGASILNRSWQDWYSEKAQSSGESAKEGEKSPRAIDHGRMVSENERRNHAG
jgi:hypothetical protein